MRVCNLASGSAGNCTYVEGDETKILVDCGLTINDLSARLGMLGVTIDDIDAVVISHEHIDHIRSVATLSKKYNKKIYAYVDEWQAILAKQSNVNPVNQMAFFELPFEIGKIKITPIKLPHDSFSCFGFCFEQNDKKFSILTDLGQTNDRILSQVAGSVLVYLEANHDEQMLMDNPNYPLSLKRRILSSRGHLSNVASAKAIEKLSGYGTKQVVLSHLSEKNNTPELAFNTVCTYLDEHGIKQGENIRIDIARQDRPTTIFNLR